MLPQSNNLYHIERRYLDLMSQIEDAEGEITSEIDAALSITQNELQGAAVNLGFVIKAFEYNEEVLKAEIQRLTNLKNKAAKSKELLKNRLSASMQYFGIERIETPTLKLSFRKSKAVEVSDIMEIPAAYLSHPPPVADKAAIREAISKGEHVPGAELVERVNLQIR